MEIKVLGQCDSGAMPKRKAGAAIERSDDDEEIPTNKKKAAASGDEDGTVACELSKNRKVLVRKFKGKVYVDIREFYNKGGEDLPSKKGISLPLDQWKMLKSHLEGIQDLIRSLN